MDGGMSMQTMIEHLRRVIHPCEDATVTDAQLLQRVIMDQDESAFELLVWRHASLVLSTCRAILGNVQSAEDAFQATFLALHRQAGSLRSEKSIAGWLHKVACRISVRARRKSSPAPSDDLNPAIESELSAVDNADLREALESELAHLPDRYRVPLILFYFQDRSVEELARELNCPRGTILSRLSRGRDRLRRQLERKGWTLSITAVLGAWAQPARAIVPRSMIHSTMGTVIQPTANVLKMAKGGVTNVLATTVKLAIPFVFTIGMGITILPMLAAEAGIEPSTALMAQSAPSSGPRTKRREKDASAWSVNKDVRAIRWGPRGKLLATWDRSRIRIWDARTGKLVCELPEMKKQGVNYFMFSPDAKILGISKRVSIEGGDVVELWDVRSGKKILVTKLEYARSRLWFDFAPDGKNLAVTYGGITREKLHVGARIVVVETGQHLQTMKIPGPTAVSVKYSPDGRLLAIGGYKGEVLLWDVQSAKLVRKMMASKEAITSMSFSPDAKSLVTCSGEGSHLWDVITGKAIQLEEAGFECNYSRFSPDGGHLVLVKTAYAKEAPAQVLLMDVRTRKVVRKWNSTMRVEVTFSADGKELAILHADRKVHWWKVSK